MNRARKMTIFFAVCGIFPIFAPIKRLTKTKGTMKKVLFLLLMCAAMTMQAQGIWETTMNEADELKGQESGEVMVYTIPHVGSFIIWGWDKYQFRLVSDESPFNTHVASGMSIQVTGLNVLVGIYDDNDKLAEKFKMWLDLEDNTSHKFIRTRDAGTMSNPVGQKGKVKKIFKVLQSSSGYVRIVAERYNTTDFDIKITPYTK